MGLIVISEDESSKTLLVHKIVAKEDYYLRSGEMARLIQGRVGSRAARALCRHVHVWASTLTLPAAPAEATIITWHDKEINTDIAISFQEQVGCDHIW